MQRLARVDKKKARNAEALRDSFPRIRKPWAYQKKS
jgi:hypothetical protein